MRLCFSGYYGSRNAGDEAVLAGALRGLEMRGIAERSHVTVFSADPPRTAQLHGVQAVSRTDLRAVCGALRAADLLVSGGGSLFQDVTSVRSVLFYAGVLWLARLMGTPYAIFAQGVGPLRRGLSRWVVRKAFLGARAVTVRDRGSEQLLAELGIPRERVTLTADPAFLLEAPGSGVRDAMRRRLGLDNGIRLIAVSARTLPDKRSGAADLSGTVKLLQERGMRVVTLPMQPGDEEPMRPLSDAGALSFPEELVGNPMAVLRYLAAADAVVGMRLHALILGVLCGCVPVALSYDPKVDAFMQEMGLEAFTVPAGAFQAEEVSALTERAINSREDILDPIGRRVEEMRVRALQGVDAIGQAAT